jgi:hypothetical protein
MMTDDEKPNTVPSDMPAGSLMAIDNPEYFDHVPAGQDLPEHWLCRECKGVSESSVVTVQHGMYCQTWLRVRLEGHIPKFPHLKFMCTKLTPIPTHGESYPVYRCQLVAPFVVMGTDGQKIMLDARAAILMRKSELKDIGAQEIFRKKRIVATHALLDIVDDGSIEVEAGQKIEILTWGTLKENYPEEFPDVDGQDGQDGPKRVIPAQMNKRTGRIILP